MEKAFLVSQLEDNAIDEKQIDALLSIRADFYTYNLPHYNGLVIPHEGFPEFVTSILGECPANRVNQVFKDIILHAQQPEDDTRH